MNDDEIRRIVEVYQNTLSLRETARICGTSKSTVARRLQTAKDRGLIPETPARPSIGIEDKTEKDERTITSSGTIRDVKTLLNECGVDLDEWILVRHTVNKWDSQTKGGGVIELFQVKAHLERRPSYFVKRVKPVAPIKRKPQTSKPGGKLCLVVPDSQHGFRRNDDGALEPLHDRRAIDCVIQAARLLKDEITDIWLAGDMLDLAAFGTYSVEPSLRYTTQPSLNELFWFLGQLRLECPSAFIRYAAGNHERRIERALNDKIDEARQLRPAGKPEARPVLSIPHLLSLDQLDIEYIEPYGAPYFWQGVRFSHGHLAKPRGKTAAAYLSSGATQDLVFGHVHRLELAQRVVESGIYDEDGRHAGMKRKVITAMTPGCLCRTDGAVPNASGSTLDWHQGFGLIYSHPDHDSPSMQLIPIIDGGCIVRGVAINGETRVDDIRNATGINI